MHWDTHKFLECNATSATKNPDGSFKSVHMKCYDGDERDCSIIPGYVSVLDDANFRVGDAILTYWIDLNNPRLWKGRVTHIDDDKSICHVVMDDGAKSWVPLEWVRKLTYPEPAAILELFEKKKPETYHDADSTKNFTILCVLTNEDQEH